MKAPEIKHYINWLGRVEYRNINCSFTYDETFMRSRFHRTAGLEAHDGTSQAKRPLSPVPKRKHRAAVLRENPRSHFRWRAAAYRSGSDPVQSGAAHLYARHSRGIHLPEPEPSGRSYPFHRCGRDPRTFKPIWRTGAISSIVAQLESGAHIWQNQRRR